MAAISQQNNEAIRPRATALVYTMWQCQVANASMSQYGKLHAQEMMLDALLLLGGTPSSCMPIKRSDGADSESRANSCTAQASAFTSNTPNHSYTLLP